MIWCLQVSTRIGKFNGAATKILKSRNHTIMSQLSNTCSQNDCVIASFEQSYSSRLKITSLSFIDLILAILGQNATCLHDCVIA